MSCCRFIRSLPASLRLRSCRRTRSVTAVLLKEILSLSTIEAVEQTYARIMADMPPDYARTEFSPLSEHRLSDDLAMVSGGGVWKNAANEDLMPFGMTYTLRRSGQTWRIVVAAIHAPDGGPGR